MALSIHNPEFLWDALKSPHPSLKFILNDEGIVFFSEARQHRTVKAHGLSYEDDYRGNAVAGLITSGRVEIRFHSAFSDNRIHNLWTQIKAKLIPPSLDTRLSELPLYYQGRHLP